MRRILVVDDDRHTRLAMGAWLRRCGFRAAITDGGESGVAALNDGTFDLIDQCLSEAERRRKQTAVLAGIASVPRNISRARVMTG